MRRPRSDRSTSREPGKSAGDQGRARPRSTGSLLAEVRATARPGQAERAVRSFEQAVSLLERGRDLPAVTAAEEAKGLTPRSGAVREVLGIALYRAGRYRDALRELQAYRRITGRVDQNHLMADCLRALGAPEKAVAAAREAVSARISEEVRSEAGVVAASALADLGRTEEALAVLRGFAPSSRAARPFDLRIWYVRGDILQRAGRNREAREEFSRVVRHDAQAFDAIERLEALGG